MNDYRKFYNFPSDWSPVSLLNSTYLKGRIGWQGLKASEFTTDGPYLVTGTNFVNGRIDWEHCYHITTERFREAPDIHLKESDLLITKDGTIGKVALVKDCPDETTLNSGIFLLRCKNKSYSHPFLYYFLLSDYFKKYLRDTQGGSTIVHLYQREFERFTFKAPGIPEQELIAEILSTIDDAIEQTQDLINKYNRIKLGLTQDLMTRGIDENGNIRSKETHQFTIKNGIEVPKEWGIITLGELIGKNGFIQTGPFGTQLHSYDYVEEGIPSIMPQDMFEEISTKNINRISEAKANQLKRHRVREDDVIFARRGDLSRCNVIRPTQIGWLCGTGCILFRQSQRVVNPHWLRLFYQSFHGQLQISINAVGSTMQNLSGALLKNLWLFSVDIDEQNRIVKKLNAMDMTIRRLIDKRAKFERIKKGLMQDLLSGKKRVKIEV